jgi:hypothetical protein
LVPAPHDRGHRREYLKNAFCRQHLVGETDRWDYRESQVGDDPITPAADFVTEDPKVCCPQAADGSLGDHAAFPAAPIRNGCHLYGEQAIGDVDSQRRVVDVAARPTVDP